MNPDELRVIVTRLTAMGYQPGKAPTKEGFLLLTKEEPFKRKLLIIGTNIQQAEDWRSFIIQTVITERNIRTPLAVAVFVFNLGEPDGNKELLADLGELPWVEVIWDKTDQGLACVKSHFRWQVEGRVLMVATQMPMFSVPAQENEPGRRGERTFLPPRLTHLLLILNLVFFLVEILLGGSGQTTVLIKLGAKYNPRLWMGEYWRLLTPLFLHASWSHFLFNALALLQLGGLVETFFGKGRFLAIYFGAGLLGTVAGVLFRPDSISVGASGAIFGLLGALIYFTIRRPQAAKRLFGRNLWVTLILNLILSFLVPGIDYMGHLGGLVGGLLCAYAIGLGQRDHLPSRWIWQVLFICVITFSTKGALTPPATPWYLPLEAGRTAFVQGDLERARIKLEESYRLNQQSILTKRLLTGVYVEQGIQALSEEAWDRAVLSLEKGYELDPGSGAGKALLVRAYLYRGFYRYNAGELTRAEEDCRKGIALDGKVEGLHYILGAVCYQQNRIPEAIKEIEAVLRLNPGNQDAQVLLTQLKEIK